MEKTWEHFLEEEFKQDYFVELKQKVASDEEDYLVFPMAKDRFNAFKMTPYNQVKVVIIGQDPYHEIGQANGLAFSVNKGFKLPPSLRNIFKELKDDVGVDHFDNGNLSGWAQQGVFLMNSVLTVRAGKAYSHGDYGWNTFFAHTMQYLDESDHPLVFILWGKKAQKAKEYIHGNHIYIESNHPSPLSAYQGFFGSKPFSKTNQALQSLNLTPIDWSK